MEQVKTTTVTINDRVIPLTDFSETVQQAFVLFDEWKVQLQKAVSKTILVQSALRSMEGDVKAAIEQEYSKMLEEEAKEFVEVTGEKIDELLSTSAKGSLTGAQDVMEKANE